MKSRLFIWISMGILLATLLSACEGSQSLSIGPCIKPAFDLAFPTYATAQPGSYPVKEILPGGDWQIESNLPGSIPDNINGIIARKDNEIWMIVSRNHGVEDPVYRYRTDTHQWSSYASIDGIAIVPETLFVTPDNTLWGIGLSSKPPELSSSKSLSILSRFDEASNQFQFVKDNEGKLQSLFSSRTPPMVMGDHLGNLWMILNDGYNTPGGLYRFDPVSGNLTRHLPDVQISQNASLAVAPNNDVWVLDLFSEAKLIQYDPTTGTLRDDFLNLRNWKIQDWRGDLYFDRSGKLWSGRDGWLDFTDPDSPVWHQIIPSPEFISDYYDGENQYVWTYPSNIYQTSNGWYWFSFPSNGIVRLNAETGDWCRFTNKYSQVVEDAQQNIRIVIEGKIYLYKVKP